MTAATIRSASAARSRRAAGQISRRVRRRHGGLGGAALRQVTHNADTIVVRAAPRVTVIGQVPTPGEFVLKNGSTLLSALYIAGGPTKWANVRDIQIVHDGVRQSYNLSNLQRGDLSANVPLVDGSA